MPNMKVRSKNPYVGELVQENMRDAIRIRNAGRDYKPGDRFYVVVPNKRGHIDGVFETVMPYPRGDTKRTDDVILDLTREKMPVAFASEDDTPLKYGDLATALEMKRTRKFITVTIPLGVSEGQPIDVSTPKGKNNVKTVVPAGFEAGSEFVIGYEAMVSLEKKNLEETASLRP